MRVIEEITGVRFAVTIEDNAGPVAMWSALGVCFPMGVAVEAQTYSRRAAN